MSHNDRKDSKSTIEQTPQEEVSQKRRNTLKSIIAGGAITGATASLPANWRKPIVESVVLPAHAQTTFEGQCFSDEGDLSFRAIETTDSTGSLPNIFQGLVGEAQAADTSGSYVVCLCERAPNRWDVQLVLDLTITPLIGNPTNITIGFTGDNVPEGVATDLDGVGLSNCSNNEQRASIEITSAGGGSVAGDIVANILGSQGAFESYSDFNASETEFCDLDLTCSPQPS